MGEARPDLGKGRGTAGGLHLLHQRRERTGTGRGPETDLDTRCGMTSSVDPDGPLAIEDYAIIGDCTTIALVGKNGSIDWLCWPRFDSAACFAALLGQAKHGRWSIAPAAAVSAVKRAYLKDT